MNIRKYIILTIFIFGIAIPVNAIELCTPTEEYKAYQKLSEEEKRKTQEPIFCSEIIKKDEKQNSFLKSNLYPKVYSSISDSSYNSYTSGITTVPKNQYSTGLCWNFAAISTVEANANKKGIGNLDLSEAHLAYSILNGIYSDTPNDKYNTDTNGGKITYAPSYFYGGYGQLTENELPFASNLILDPKYEDGTQTLKTISSNNYPKGRNIVTLNDYYLENISNSGTCSTTDINTIKSSIIKNGSVLATMYMDQELFLDANENYYISKSENNRSINHGVVIVGWDDTISKSNFNGATRNGAWIIKNSWGTDWSNDGFFYISYDDEFICNTTANYELSSTTKSYDYTYKSSPVVGIPLLSLSDTFYIATKFNKQSTNEKVKEQLEKISISVGEYMSYTVYLSKDNNKTNQSNWIEIASGNSTLYGIKSFDITNQEISDDYTLIVKYEVDSNQDSSLFMTCDYMDDTNNIDYKTNSSFISTNGSSWTDMANLSLGGISIKCQPNNYVYTNEISELEITNTNPSSTGIEVDLKLININTNNIVYKVENSNNEDVTSHFTINPNYNTKKVAVTTDGKVSGIFTFKIIYESIERTTTFSLTENFSIKDDTIMKIDNDNNMLYTVIEKGVTFTYESLIKNINSENNQIIVKNNNNEVVTSGTVGTGYTITTNSNTYSIVISGDATGDGKINSGDLVKIVKHLKGTTTTNEAQRIASDCNNDNKVNSGDLVRLVKFLKGTSSITIRG